MSSFSWRTDRGTRNSLKLERLVHIVNININNVLDNIVARAVYPAIILVPDDRENFPGCEWKDRP